jgi:hypothetical protein
MAFNYARDDVHHRIVVTLYGAFHKDEGLAVFKRHYLEDVGNYSVLYDLRGLTGKPTLADMRLFMTEELTITTNESRGPIALVANDPMMYAMACTYAVLGRPNLTIEAFRERREADAWLTSQHHKGFPDDLCGDVA